MLLGLEELPDEGFQPLPVGAGVEGLGEVEQGAGGELHLLQHLWGADGVSLWGSRRCG